MILGNGTYKVGDKNVLKMYQGANQRFAAGTPWTLVMIPDTQYFIHNQGIGVCPAANGGELILPAMCQYIADQKDAKNIKFVQHIGDICGSPTTTQFGYAATSRQAITTAGIPNMWAPGNHDYEDHALGSSRNLSTYRTYLPLSSYSSEDWFGGSFDGNPENIYTVQTIEGEKWLFFSVEFYPRSEVMTWMNNTIASEAPDFCVVSTHAYVAPSAWQDPLPAETFWDGVLINSAHQYGPNVYGSAFTTSGEDLYNTVISQNDCIVLVLCGHVLDGRHDSTESWGGTNNGVVAHSGKQFTHANGNVCTQIVYNHQNDSILACNDGKQGSSPTLHFFEVNPTNRTIHAYGYDPYHDVYSADLGTYPTLLPDWSSRHDLTFNY